MLYLMPLRFLIHLLLVRVTLSTCYTKLNLATLGWFFMSFFALLNAPFKSLLSLVSPRRPLCSAIFNALNQRALCRKLRISHYTDKVSITNRRIDMTIHKYGTAHWEGDIKQGKGYISTESGALKDQPYGFNTRFEGKAGSNPEELIGAAHSACFSMALSLILGEAKLTAEQIETKADVTLEKQGDGFAITSVHLTLVAKIPGADKTKFAELVEMAKAGCPVSRLLNAK